MRIRGGPLLLLLFAGCATTTTAEYINLSTGQTEVCRDDHDPGAWVALVCIPCYFATKGSAYADCKTRLEEQGFVRHDARTDAILRHLDPALRAKLATPARAADSPLIGTWTLKGLGSTLVIEPTDGTAMDWEYRSADGLYVITGTGEAGDHVSWVGYYRSAPPASVVGQTFELHLLLLTNRLVGRLITNQRREYNVTFTRAEP